MKVIPETKFDIYDFITITGSILVPDGINHLVVSASITGSIPLLADY